MVGHAQRARHTKRHGRTLRVPYRRPFEMNRNSLRHNRQTKRLLTIACAILVSFVAATTLPAAEIGATHVATWKDDKQVPFVLMFDDSMPSHVKTVLPELKRRNLIGTFYINPGSGHFKAHKVAWEKEFPAAGMVLANHTFTHKGARDVANCEEEITQCNDVLNAIAAATGGSKPTLISFGRPGVPKGAWNVTDEELAQLLSKHHLVIRSNVLFAQIHLKDAPAMIARVQKALDSGKPDAVAFHGVGGEWLSIDVLPFLALLDFIVERREQLWITDPISIHKYETERATAKVETIETGPRQIRLRLGSEADPAVYDGPLTLVTQAPAEWKSVEVTQGDRTKTVTPVNGVLMYDAWPGADPIVLKAR
jgi:peptidoglycan/xylan/chitin deacetylase (PgdA/CDA1 family)